MTDPALLVRFDALLVLLALVVVALGFMMVLLDATLGVVFMVVLLLVGVVAARSYILALRRGATDEPAA